MRSKNKSFLQSKLNDGELLQVIEAHNPLCAKIAESAGFSSFWASSFTISASMGVCDRNELSWTQVVDLVDMITDAVSGPVIVDVDSGYGNFNNFTRACRALEKRGASAVCVEDKLFPKVNSFSSVAQELESVRDFTAKIRSATDARHNTAFQIIARTETLIVGGSMSEALDRSAAYVEAGADAILVHSKERSGDEVLQFLNEWKRFSPVILVPTAYPNVAVSRLHEAGASAVIWANHCLRASVKAIELVTRRILQDGGISGVDNEIVAMSEIFNLTGEDRRVSDELRYLG